MERYKQRPYTSNKRNSKLLEQFKKIEGKEHHDRRLIAWNLAIDYHKQQAKIRKLEKLLDLKK